MEKAYDESSAGWDKMVIQTDEVFQRYEESLSASDGFVAGFGSNNKDSLDNRHSSMSNESLPLERMAPLGASATDTEDYPDCAESSFVENPDKAYCESRLQTLEEEQEQLIASLVQLTTHFAQVQFRLQQITEAPVDEKQLLLKELEEFASRGIPDVRGLLKDSVKQSLMLPESLEETVEYQKLKQQELIAQLKSQLAELESFAYETGEAGPPQMVILEKQKVIIDQLRNRLDLNVEDLDKLSVEQLKMQVDHAVSQLISPLKMKEQLLEQLTTQIQDLERFVEFLQEDGQGCSKKHCTCNCPVHGHNQGSLAPYIGGGSRAMNGRRFNNSDEIKENSLKVMQRVLHFLHVFAAGQFGCAAHPFKKNILKETVAGNHWGDQRAALQMAIDKLVNIAERAKRRTADDEYTSDSEETPPLLLCDEQLVASARKSFAPALRDLIHHGLMKNNLSSSSMALVPVTACFSRRSANAQQKMLHAWDLILGYYDMKRGPSYNATPQRRLSESFGLDIVGGKAVTTKQTLLSAIGSIISSHTPLKRSCDAHFKAFVCEGLNRRKLVPWLKLIFRTHGLIDEYYQPWSYAARTGFEDAFRAMEKLQGYNFQLPVDLAVQQLRNIKDAF